MILVEVMLYGALMGWTFKSLDKYKYRQAICGFIMMTAILIGWWLE